MPMISALKDLGRPPKVLILGSGGLSIGQAGEFDYSGTQASIAIKEEGCQVIIVNPNIATVQTNPQKNSNIYLYPVEPHWVEKVIEIEKPDAIVAGFGGQTALNCLIKLHDAGILKKHNVINLGTPVEVLKLTEDRDLFARHMDKIGQPICHSKAVETLDAAVSAANEIGYPLIIRAAYALGGLGSGFANNEEELRELVESALTSSPQVLVEKSVKGWKEVEYEVMRDSEGNTITICNMENFDPLGIHTGDSIVVCPSQSLSDDDYQLLRNAAIDIVESLGIVGECNVQYALDPKSMQYYVIEVNARLSRSSALASKASGYPIAYIAAKVVLGFDLLELKNPVTGVTFAFFEPALDYVTIKVPRWDLTKFQGVSRLLGSTMKSVGEIMAIGRSFPEALQKSIRMISEHPEGMTRPSSARTEEELIDLLTRPTDERMLAISEAFRRGWDVDRIHEMTKIDKWFLSQTRWISTIEHEIRELAISWGGSNLSAGFAKIDADTWRRWKKFGFGDQQIAGTALRACPDQDISNGAILKLSLEIRSMRIACNVTPVVKKIDTTAGEYPSPSNYLYMSYNGQFSDEIEDDGKKNVGIVLGGGSYRIGTSVEFDWCAVSCSERMRADGWRSVIINCNPETVSTDYNSSDRLYFDELTLERIMDIADFESATGIVACMGGQLPNTLAIPLADAGLKLLGHSAQSIDQAENRAKFSQILDNLGIDQPRWISATTIDELEQYIDEIGFPVLIRPSYVLSGAAMNVAIDWKSLKAFLAEAVNVSEEYPIVISEFIEGAREIELDGVAQDGKVLVAIVSEHVENAGVHSGDATTVVPAQNLYVETVRRVRKAGRAIAQELKLNGPFNIQFMAKEGSIKVIECNVRAARSFPFVSKTVGLNLAEVSTEVMLGNTPRIPRVNEDNMPHVGIKAAMFSFKRLANADPVLGVEMASTGEVGCLGDNFDEALLLALEATGNSRPKNGVLVSSGPEKQKLKFLQAAEFIKGMGLPLYATKGTAEYLASHGFEVTSLAWPDESEDNCVAAIKSGKVDLVINIPKSHAGQELSRGSQIRAAAITYGASLFTNMEKAVAFVRACDRNPDFNSKHTPVKLPDFEPLG